MEPRRFSGPSVTGQRVDKADDGLTRVKVNPGMPPVAVGDVIRLQVGKHCHRMQVVRIEGDVLVAKGVLM